MPYEVVEDFQSYRRGQQQRVILLDHDGIFSGPELPEEWDVEPDPDFEFGHNEHEVKELVNVLPSEFTEFAVMMPDKENQTYKNFTFSEREYLRQIYDTPSKRTLLKCGRQVEKSTMLGNKLLSYSCIVAALNSLYVSPTNQQSKVFSQDRLKEPIETSAFLKSWTTTKLSDNVFLKKFINRSQITLRYAFMNADRCLVGDTRVQLGTGEVVPIRDLISYTHFDVVSLGKHYQPIVENAARVKSGGFRSIVEVQSGYPVPLRCTPDHKILTARGMVEAQSLREGDFIAAPHAGHLVGGIATGVDESMAWLIGAMTAEGECSNPGSVRFTNTDEEFIREFIERAQAAGIKTGKIVVDSRYQTTCYSVALYSDERGPGLNGGKSILWDVGEFGSKSYDKKIPRSIWLAPISTKAAFLQALFRGDGSCHEENGFGRAEYSTSSKRLAEDICHLLWGLGIRSSLREKGPSTDNARPSYAINFSAHDTTKLVRLIGEYRPGLTYREEAGKNVKDRIPISYDWLRGYLLSRHGLSTHAAWTQYEIQLRPGNRKDSIGRRVLTAVADKLGDDYLRSLAQTSWVAVREVVPCPIEEEVFDIIDAGSSANFLANGLIVSNCRGIPADIICMDELQDLLTDNIPVIEECASHSVVNINCERHKGGIFLYAGTPKSLDNTIEVFWNQFSTQNEWVVPCHKHSIFANGRMSKMHWNILSEEHLGLKSLICDKCGSEINSTDKSAQWAALNPDIIKEIPKPYEGFRIPQLMVPWISHQDLLQKQKTYPRDRFYNEVLGLSYDSGTRPLTQQDVIDNCSQYLQMDDLSLEKIRSHFGPSYPVYAGIDWGTGEGSFTVLTLGAYIDNKFQIFYYRKFEGRDSDPQTQLDEIIHTINKWNVKRIGVDYGGGFWPNDKLTNQFGMLRVAKYQYSTPTDKVRWEDGLKRFLVNRTEVMSDVFNAIKKRDVFRFPNWNQFKLPFAADFLNIFAEYNEQRRMIEYKKSPGTTDDSYHSSLYCFLVSMLDTPRPDIIAPSLHPRATKS